MLTQHASMLDTDPAYHATAASTPSGVMLTVTAKNASDQKTVTRIRGLGLAGLITEGNHHALHHLAIARGEAHPHMK
jgi:hypothetical protein